MKNIEEVAKSVAEVLPAAIPEGYVIAFVIMPVTGGPGTEFLLGSIPAMVGGSEAIVSMFEVVSDHASDPIRDLDFAAPSKH